MQSQRWLSTILGSIRDGVIAVDALGMVVLLNRAAAELTGWAPDEAVGRELAQVLPAQDPVTGQDVELPFLDMIVQEQRASECCVRLSPRGGAPRLVTATGAPMSDDSGHVCGVVVVLREAA